MAVEAAAGPMKGKLVVRNIGLLLSGDLAKPILDADTIVAVDGRITAVGKAKDVDTDKPDRVVDAKACTVTPGLIDSHCHPVFGDWTPRQNQLRPGSTRASTAASPLSSRQARCTCRAGPRTPSV